MVEILRFSAQCAELGTAYDIDEALKGVYFLLAMRADLYPVLPGCRTLRMISIGRFPRPFGYLPPLRIYFRITEDDLVELAWIEEAI